MITDKELDAIEEENGRVRRGSRFPMGWSTIEKLIAEIRRLRSLIKFPNSAVGRHLEKYQEHNAALEKERAERNLEPLIELRKAHYVLKCRNQELVEKNNTQHEALWEANHNLCIQENKNAALQKQVLKLTPPTEEEAKKMGYGR